MESTLAPGVASQAPASEPPSRVIKIRPEDGKLLCVLGDGRQFALSQLVGWHVRTGDEVSVAGLNGVQGRNREFFTLRNNSG